jgi:hypothetical protein
MTRTNSSVETSAIVSRSSFFTPALTNSMSNLQAASPSLCGNPIWVDDVDGLDFEPTVGLRGEVMELRLASAALGCDDEPVALQIFLGQGEAKASRCANEKKSFRRGFAWHLRCPSAIHRTSASDTGQKAALSEK